MDKERKEKIIYIVNHKKAFLKVEKELTQKNSLRGLAHDMDKIFLIIFTRKPLEEISKNHRLKSKHHVNNIQKTEKDYIEMAIDWECARYTKPDKPLNAYQTLFKYHPQVAQEMLPVFQKLNLYKERRENNE